MRDLGVILKYMHEPVASSSSDESLGEVDDEEALHEQLPGQIITASHRTNVQPYLQCVRSFFSWPDKTSRQK